MWQETKTHAQKNMYFAPDFNSMELDWYQAFFCYIVVGGGERHTGHQQFQQSRGLVIPGMIAWAASKVTGILMDVATAVPDFPKNATSKGLRMGSSMEVNRNNTAGMEAANALGGWLLGGNKSLTSMFEYAADDPKLVRVGAHAVSGWPNAREHVWPYRCDPFIMDFDEDDATAFNNMIAKFFQMSHFDLLKHSRPFCLSLLAAFLFYFEEHAAKYGMEDVVMRTFVTTAIDFGFNLVTIKEWSAAVLKDFKTANVTAIQPCSEGYESIARTLAVEMVQTRLQHATLRCQVDQLEQKLDACLTLLQSQAVTTPMRTSPSSSSRASPVYRTSPPVAFTSSPPVTASFNPTAGLPPSTPPNIKRKKRSLSTTGMMMQASQVLGNVATPGVVHSFKDLKNLSISALLVVWYEKGLVYAKNMCDCNWNVLKVSQGVITNCTKSPVRIKMLISSALLFARSDCSASLANLNVVNPGQRSTGYTTWLSDLTAAATNIATGLERKIHDLEISKGGKERPVQGRSMAVTAIVGRIEMLNKVSSGVTYFKPDAQPGSSNTINNMFAKQSGSSSSSST